MASEAIREKQLAGRLSDALGIRVDLQSFDLSAAVCKFELTLPQLLTSEQLGQNARTRGRIGVTRRSDSDLVFAIL